MKLVMDERLKHRLVGISVILSLGAIFLPAMMKKSSQRLESNFSVKVQLPPKPNAPNVAVTNEEQMFKTIKVAKVELTPSMQSKAKAEDFVAKAPIKNNTLIPVSKIELAPKSINRPIEFAINEATNKAVKNEIKVASIRPIDPIRPVVPVKPVRPVKTKVVVAKPPVVIKAAQASVLSAKTAGKRDIYAVQLASFVKISNAEALVHKLQQKGYKANYIRVAGRKNVIYKVYVGHSPIKEDVVKLRTQLASVIQLNGFVVNTGVS
ncbi:MAG: SPOR domain-containing protein [Legionella sp.]|uniref:SPOR domain-containing protein n=1 Tax=Legionella sp. TaxID=459 RepID=UPI0039E3849E